MSLEKFNSVSYDFKIIKAVDSKIRRIILDCLRHKPGGAANGSTAKVRAGPGGRFPSAQPC